LQTREIGVIHLPLSHALLQSEAKETEYICYADNRGSLTGWRPPVSSHSGQWKDF